MLPPRAAPARGRFLTLPLLVAALALAPRPGGAQAALPPCPATLSTAAGPFLGLLVGNACVDLSGSVRRTDSPAPVWSAQVDETVGGVRFQISATFDADPFISFGATTTNLTAGPVTYAFLFGTPIVPGLYNTATSTGGVTVTAGQQGSATVATGGVYPTFISGYGTVGSAATNLGVDLGTTACSATTTTTCNYGTASNVFAPTFYDNLEALLTYTQTEVGSVASWSGRVELLDQPATTVPEPATVALLAAGLVVVGGVARRRRAR